MCVEHYGIRDRLVLARPAEDAPEEMNDVLHVATDVVEHHRDEQQSNQQ
jgi:hypothetical protein